MSQRTTLQDPDEPQRKRPRTVPDSGTGSDEPPFSRDAKFWYPDGSIIILAQNVGFRVFKSLLAASSDVFRDMFALAQPSDHLQDASDDYPVVHVSDTAAEMRSLLTVLLDARQYMWARRTFAFEDIANCVRLAHKYGIKDLLKDSLAEIERYYPAKFESWDTRAIPCADGHAIIAVNLARLTGTTSLLPAALYCCCQMNARELMDGYERSDGTVDRLSKEDLERCIDGKSHLSLHCMHRPIPHVHPHLPLYNPIA
ncbi:uncharacterized protein C8Q71DRAFT_863137 [Rhodofomes roseus]|uniref:BTB domain-containing protein n=1 Tax=Rhodofomes roseus TaxID=34475 RepID=A0ABQ8JZN1_9APHY|nr:uncharacterized protein C8Q71DRAFT_863137 [Rhodofomes roseus]KAH9829564.1 hypothetical protein C8Q71DRAFT_863137 [Rhodofomes roseus]